MSGSGPVQGQSTSSMTTNLRVADDSTSSSIASESSSESSHRTTQAPPPPRRELSFGAQLRQAFRHGFRGPRPVTLDSNTGRQEPSSNITTGGVAVSNQDWTTVAPNLHFLTSFRAGKVDAQEIKTKYRKGQEAEIARLRQGYSSDGAALTGFKNDLSVVIRDFENMVGAAGEVKDEIRALTPDRKMDALKDLSAMMAEVGGDTASSNAGYEIQKQLFRAIRHELTVDRSGMNGMLDKVRGRLNLQRDSAHVVRNPRSQDLRDVLLNLAVCRDNVHLPNDRGSESTSVSLPDFKAKRDLENKLDQFINSQLPRLTPADQTMLQNART